MRYYLVEGTSSGGPPSLWSRILAGVILAALVALGVVLFIFFFYVFLVVAAAAVFLGLLALLISALRSPPRGT
ncbi:MAG: hypothetical protein GX100_02590 [candidate division WS1 bacterium]|jgi:hypothetical protein|nr:hypothetical protein [candidate division WS1 bacterium]